MNPVMRWAVVVIVWIILLAIFGLWRVMDTHMGGSALSGAIRGVLVFGGMYLIFKWGKGGKKKEE